jgi:DNA-binding HxlR family transcriptional regulator
METIGHTLGEPPSENCGIERALEVLDGRWATLIVRELLAGPLRFSEIRRRLGDPSAKTITERLRRMERYGVVTRTVHAEVPPRVVYELTDQGRGLEPVLVALLNWGDSLVPPIRSAQQFR